MIGNLLARRKTDCAGRLFWRKGFLACRRNDAALTIYLRWIRREFAGCHRQKDNPPNRDETVLWQLRRCHQSPILACSWIECSRRQRKPLHQGMTHRFSCDSCIHRTKHIAGNLRRQLCEFQRTYFHLLFYKRNTQGDENQRLIFILRYY